MPRVAVIGASRDRSKFGNTAVRAYLARGYEVFPIHPTETRIEGLRAYRSVLDVPGDLDRITVYVPPTVGMQLLQEIARKRAIEVWFNPGAANELLLKQAEALGIPAVHGCSIVDIGLSPGDFP